MAKCVNCKYAQWQLTPTGRIKKNESGRCGMPVPERPVFLCAGPQPFHKRGIWPGCEGHCDAFEPKEADHG